MFPDGGRQKQQQQQQREARQEQAVEGKADSKIGCSLKDDLCRCVRRLLGRRPERPPSSRLERLRRSCNSLRTPLESAKLTGRGGDRWVPAVERRLRRTLSGPQRPDGWLLRRLPFALLLALAFWLPVAQLAPLAGVQPIWLHDGLISLEPRAADQEVLLELPTDLPADAEQPVEWPAERRASWRDKVKDAIRPAQEEPVWMERRRLNRDRALEPAPWLREQPMRRNSEWLSPRSARGRQSRQSVSQIYEEILRHLLEEALHDQAFLDELYEELEQRVQSRAALELAPAAAAQPLRLLDQQQAGLVVASDEVAGAEEEGERQRAAKLVDARPPSDQPAEFAADQSAEQAASFHVVEDIDQVAEPEQEPASERPQAPQVLQLAERTDWLEARPARDKRPAWPNERWWPLLVELDASQANYDLSGQLDEQVEEAEEEKSLASPQLALAVQRMASSGNSDNRQQPATYGRLLVQSGGQRAGGHLWLALLAAYLRAFQRERASEQPPALASEQQARARRPQPAPQDRHLVQLAALLLAAAGALVAVKLAMQKGGPRLLASRPLWRRQHNDQDSDEPLSQADCLAEAKQPAPLGAGQPLRRQSGDSNLATSLDDKSALDLLTQRLMGLLASRRGAELAPLDSKDNDKIETSELAEQEREPPAEQPGGFRTSRSYIKSLMDVLGRARTQLPGGLAGPPTRSPTHPDHEQAAAGEPAILKSQMDISAAHLILAYMERHLEDKERLRREWLELNQQQQQQQVQVLEQGGHARPSQLILRRLAKVALSEENLAKNRTPQVVPFDRNRVKLKNQTPTGRQQQQQRAAANGNRRSQAHKARPQTATCSDYINASLIHDHDPRRPTHIIAQGPTEQTVSQFWQMVWEQGVSIIVMLTRLNENSVRMCHCYWPTSSSSSSSATTSGESGGGGGEPTSPPAGELHQQVAARSEQTAASPGNGSAHRRASVTSVFNTNGARQLNSNGQPIIANGDLANNVLAFQLGHSGSSAGSSLDEEEPDGDAQPKLANQNGQVQRFELHLVSEHVSSSDYLVRNMYLINRTSGETRTITQFHYLAWPDQGVPDQVRSFLEFRRKVHKSYRDLRAPILVHCSDGAGRSGTYTLIDMILERIRKGAKEIDPRATLEHLRDQRVGLCATQSQFEFVLVALAEEIQLILNALAQ